MDETAVLVQGLGKQYRLGTFKTAYRTIRETIMEGLPLFLRWGRKGAPTPSNEEKNRVQTFWALKDVSFEVKQGEVLGIIGRNGAGKSTLLKILSRITSPTEGKVSLYGRVGSLLEVGTGFHPELTGRENIFLNGAILGMKREEIRRNFDEIVSFAEVDKFIDTPVKYYSSGMYVRLAFAVAAHLEPEILLVDEVLAVGDASFQKKCLNKMQDIGQGGRTVLFVSHNMGAIQTLCSRVLLFDGGTLIKEGSPSEVVSFYLIQGNTALSHKSWIPSQRPGNRGFRLASVSLKDETGVLLSEVNLSEKANVEIEFEVLQEGVRPVLSVVLFDGNGYCVWSSLSNTEENEYYGKPLSPGMYRSTCEIYGNLLNNGRYFISIIGVSDHWTNSFRVDHILSFEAVDDGKLKRDYPGNYGGSVRPRLRWSSIRIQSGPV
jgi:lipopolysaccharide transport system ATP-binding protein